MQQPPIPPRPPLPPMPRSMPTSMPTSTNPSFPPTATPSHGWIIIARVKAIMLVLTCLFAMAACIFLSPVLARITADQDVKLGEFGTFFMNYPWVGALLGLPALAACVPLLRGGKHPIVWMTVATLLVLLPFAYLLGGFVSVMEPLYNPPGL